LDNAGKGRLIIRNHNISGEDGRKEWEAGFAGVKTDSRPDGKVLPIIRKYLEKNPADIRPVVEKNSESVIVDGRRWTYLSEAIIKNLGYKATNDEIYQFTASLGLGYIGAYAKRFCQFLEENKRFTVKDVLAGTATKAERDNAIELVEQLLAIDIPGLTQTELANLITFVRTLDQEMLVSYISDQMAKFIEGIGEDDAVAKKALANKNFIAFNKEFAKEIQYIDKNIPVEK